MMNLERRIDEWIAAHRDEILGFLSRLVQTPSEVCPPRGDELACQRVVEAAYREAGAIVDVFTPDEVPGLREHPAFFGTWDGMPRTFENRPDVVGLFRGAGGGRSFLLSAHVDTVSREPLPWTEAEPFSGAIKSGRLYGRGSWDTKWGVAVGLYAMRCLRALDAELRGDVIIESVVDEEYGGGHGTLAARLRGYNADIAANCEPTGMVVAPAHHGGGEWRIIVRGDAGMAFGDRKLTNSVYKLARLIEAVRAFDADRNARLAQSRACEADTRHVFFRGWLPAYTFQLGGGGDSYAQVSGIPAACYLIIWVEERPGTDEATHTRQLTGFINDYLARDPDFDGVYPEYRQTIRYLPGTSIDPAHPFFGVLGEAFERCQREYELAGAPLACDTFVFNMHSSTPAFTLGPRGGNAHAADEFVLVEDVIDLIRIYARAILAWCK
jgi:acetylornithine deacetylase